MARILVLTSMYPPHHYGGYELLCRDVVDRWRAAGHTVGVLTSTVRVPDQPDPPDERDVWRDLRIYWDDHRIVNPPLLERVRIERGNQRALARAIEDVQPDVISVWAVGAMSLGLLTTLAKRKTPVVYVVCDDWVTYAPQIDAWTRLFARRPRAAAIVRALTRIPTRLPRLGATGAFLFMSDHSRVIFDSHIGPLRDSSVVYGGIDTNDFPIATVTEATAAARRPFLWRLLVVSRIDPRKGIATVLRALATLPATATLAVVGRGDDEHRAELEALAVELGVGDRVTFGALPRHELHARYQAADVLVFPSEWQEPFGLVPIEAMASGTPVVGTGTGGSDEFLVDGDNCLRYPRRDPTALASAMRRLADDPGLRVKIVTGGLRTAAELTIDRWAAVLSEWHLAAADGFVGGRPPDRSLG